MTLLTNDEVDAARARGAELACAIRARYGTSDVFEIAERAAVRVVYACWSLVTVGEYDARTRTVTVNLAALDCLHLSGNDDERQTTEALRRVIIAHELGHLFMSEDASGTRSMKRMLCEEVAHGFARSLLNLSFPAEAYEIWWRREMLRETGATATDI